MEQRSALKPQSLHNRLLRCVDACTFLAVGVTSIIFWTLVVTAPFGFPFPTLILALGWTFLATLLSGALDGYLRERPSHGIY